MNNKEYVAKLEDIVKQTIKPLRNIPLKLVIESLSGYKIRPFKEKDKKDQKLLKNLIKTAKGTTMQINKKGIKRTRPNEVGNDIEKFVERELLKIDYKAHTPLTTSGRKKTTGYPDIEFIDENGRTNYLECKTYNIENIATTQRSFYLSPSCDFKITKNAHHFAISFEIYVHKSRGKMNTYKCNGWKILDLEKLPVDVKHEFNADNLRLYSKELILAEGKL